MIIPSRHWQFKILGGKRFTKQALFLSSWGKKRVLFFSLFVLAGQKYITTATTPLRAPHTTTPTGPLRQSQVEPLGLLNKKQRLGLISRSFIYCFSSGPVVGWDWALEFLFLFDCSNISYLFIFVLFFFAPIFLCFCTPYSTFFYLKGIHGFSPFCFV